MSDVTPAEAPAADTVAEDFEVGSLLRQALRDEHAQPPGSTAATHPEGDPEELQPPEPGEPAAGITADDSADAAGQDSTPPPSAEHGDGVAQPGDATGDEGGEPLDDWGAVVLTYPGRIAEVPVAHRKAVLENAFEQARTAAVSQYVEAAQKVLADTQQSLQGALAAAYQKGLTDGKTGILADADFVELEALQDSDPAAFAALSKSEPAKVAKFLTRADAKAVEPEVKKVLADVNRRLERHPQAHEILREYEAREPNRYNPQANPNALANLVSDVDIAIEQAIERRLSTGGQETAGAQETRNGNGAARGAATPPKIRSVPKPMVTAGTPAGSQDEPLPDDENELFRIAYRKEQAERAQRR